jgi:isopentenyl-diphosphate Delta-isomerase
MQPVNNYRRPPSSVELVNSIGTAVGRCTVEEAHSGIGALHRAFSTFIFDARGRLLLQRRAWTKSRFPGLWSNTCCSHPDSESSLEECAERRLRDELGLTVTGLRRQGSLIYRAQDPRSSYVEHEFDHVLVGYSDSDPTAAAPEEVAEWRWATRESVASELASRPAEFTPWFSLAASLAYGRDPDRIEFRNVTVEGKSA